MRAVFTCDELLNTHFVQVFFELNFHETIIVCDSGAPNLSKNFVVIIVKFRLSNGHGWII